MKSVRPINVRRLLAVDQDFVRDCKDQLQIEVVGCREEIYVTVCVAGCRPLLCSGAFPYRALPCT